MSVTVSDLLNLPSLKQAKVIGGHKGLNKIVSSVSVLESVDPGNLTEDIFSSNEYIGSEIVITGFINCIDDVECQCANIRRLAEGGEVGMILFYVGIFLPEVNQKLIDVANELDFVLIQMPSIRTLRYSEVINDVMSYIFSDNEKHDSIVTDILARVSALSEQQRTVNTVLRMIGDRVLASIILTDESFKVINLLSWPQGIEEQLRQEMSALHKYASEGKQYIFEKDKNRNINHFEFYSDGGILMHLFIVKEGEKLGQKVLEQIQDIVRICMNIWGRSHGTIAIRELIRAILQDDPMKMRRLSDIFHIDIESIHEMWIVQGDKVSENIESICESLKAYTKTAFADVYEGKLLVFSSTITAQKATEDIIFELTKEGMSVSRCSGLQTTADVRGAYLCYKEHFQNAQKIYPDNKWISYGDLEYAKSCWDLVEEGEEKLRNYKRYLSALEGCSEEWDAVRTLSVYLLDADMSVTKTAEKLFIHKNTVKYRLKIISDMLGFKVDKMPESIYLYQALAINRLIK